MASPAARITSVSIVVVALSSSIFAQDNLSSLRPFELSSATHLTLNTLGATRFKALQHTNVGGPTLFVDDYSTYQLTDYTNLPNGLAPLIGQVNPAGLAWTGSSFNNWFGAATLEIMQAAGASHPVGDSPAFGPITTFAAAARKTGEDEFNPNFNSLAIYRLGLFTPTVGQPVVVSQDIYLSSVDNQPRTSLWWSPSSSVEGVVLDRIFYGGTNIPSSGNTNPIEFAFNSEGILDRILTLGFDPNSSILGQFFAPAQHPNFPPPVNQWFTLMVHLSVDSNGSFGYSVWVKTQDTVASNPPFVDPRMAVGDIPAIDNDPTGWINLYPGFPDDPATTDVIEGIGLGANALGQPSPNTSPLGQAPPLVALTFDDVLYGTGLDDADDPAFQADDYFFANFRVQGPTPAAVCAIDLNFDNTVDGADLAILLVNWGASGVQADFNGDGVVNGADLANLLVNFGAACP